MDTLLVRFEGRDRLIVFVGLVGARVAGTSALVHLRQRVVGALVKPTLSWSTALQRRFTPAISCDAHVVYPPHAVHFLTALFFVAIGRVYSMLARRCLNNLRLQLRFERRSHRALRRADQQALHTGLGLSQQLFELLSDTALLAR